MSMSNEAFDHVVWELDRDEEFLSLTPEEKGKKLRVIVSFAPLGYSQQQQVLSALLLRYHTV